MDKNKLCSFGETYDVYESDAYIKSIINLKLYYAFYYTDRTYTMINHHIDTLVKADYSIQEIQNSCDNFLNILYAPNPIKYKLYEEEKERKNKTMAYLNFDNRQKYEVASLDTLDAIGTIKIPSLLLSDYKEEKDNKLTYGFNVPGIRIKCEEIWNNKEKKSKGITLKDYKLFSNMLKTVIENNKGTNLTLSDILNRDLLKEYSYDEYLMFKKILNSCLN